MKNLFHAKANPSSLGVLILDILFLISTSTKIRKENERILQSVHRGNYCHIRVLVRMNVDMRISE